MVCDCIFIIVIRLFRNIDCWHFRLHHHVLWPRVRVYNLLGLPLFEMRRSWYWIQYTGNTSLIIFSLCSINLCLLYIQSPWLQSCQIILHPSSAFESSRTFVTKSIHARIYVLKTFPQSMPPKNLVIFIKIIIRFIYRYFISSTLIFNNISSIIF